VLKLAPQSTAVHGSVSRLLKAAYQYVIHTFPDHVHDYVTLIYVYRRRIIFSLFQIASLFSFQVSLQDYNAKHGQFRILPRYKVKSEGEVVGIRIKAIVTDEMIGLISFVN
jgi:hypothetical protein